jgi:hypothetical protein
MKQILNILFLLFTILSFAQQTYKFTEGELQFIHPEEGIFIKKDNVIYKLDLENIADYEEFSKGFKYEFYNISIKDVENLKKDISTIFVNEIIKYDFNKLNKKKFITKAIDNDNYQFVKYNKDFFVVGVLDDSLEKPRNYYLLHYCILDFGKGKKILYHSEGYIIPTNEKLNFLFEHEGLNNAFKNYATINYKKLKANEIQILKNGDLELNGDFYKIDTLKSKKLRIKNCYNQIAINKEFDSIAYTSNFIVGYKNKKIDIYNYTFEKLKLKNVKAISFNEFYPNLQIIQDSKLRNINLIGNDFKVDDISVFPSFNHFFPSNTVLINVTKENLDFYIQSDIFYSLPNNQSFENKFKIINSEKYKSIEFLNEETFITLYSEIMSYSIKYPLVIYTELKNGKFNLNTIDYLITENPSNKIQVENDNLPKDLDKIIAVTQGVYKIQKDELITYYPIQKEIKYKKIEDFQENFARFELPNGKKGWLSKDGKEYLDE